MSSWRCRQSSIFAGAEKQVDAAMVMWQALAIPWQWQPWLCALRLFRDMNGLVAKSWLTGIHNSDVLMSVVLEWFESAVFELAISHTQLSKRASST